MSRLYPIFADIEGRLVVVIGGGSVAQRKVEVLLDSSAKVKVVSPNLTDKLLEWSKLGKIEVFKRGYELGDTAGAWLVIAASDDEQANRAIFAEAQERGIFCNVVDVPELCSFQVPAIVKRDTLQIAISTGGASPALAKRIRKELEKQFDRYYETFLAGLRELREHVKQKYPHDQAQRATIFEGFVNSQALDLLRADQMEQYQKLLAEWKNR
jgi:precorrin-2 dehydrogenase/sirohydrochlorin ferrochelatase